jgi:hypothetical protein
MPEHLLQPSDVPPVSHAVNRKRVSEGMRMDIFSDDRTIALDYVAHSSLFEGKNRLIIWEVCAETYSESILIVSASK